MYAHGYVYQINEMLPIQLLTTHIQTCWVWSHKQFSIPKTM